MDKIQLWSIIGISLVVSMVVTFVMGMINGGNEPQLAPVYGSGMMVYTKAEMDNSFANVPTKAELAAVDAKINSLRNLSLSVPNHKVQAFQVTDIQESPGEITYVEYIRAYDGNTVRIRVGETNRIGDLKIRLLNASEYTDTATFVVDGSNEYLISTGQKMKKITASKDTAVIIGNITN